MHPEPVVYTLGANDVLKKGLSYVRKSINERRISRKGAYEHFKSYYGSTHVDVAKLWYDLVLLLDPKERNEKGFSAS